MTIWGGRSGAHRPPKTAQTRNPQNLSVTPTMYPMNGPEGGAPPDAEVRRRSRLREPAVLWLVAILVVVLIAWGSVAGLGAVLHGSGCSQPTQVEVAAAPA